MKRWSLAFVLLAMGLCSNALAQAAPPVCTYGEVFADRNGDGRRDGNEAGLAGIAVSNGRDIVRSDAQGRYRFPEAGGGPVFVIKPAGYVLGRRADGLPDHWRQAAIDASGSCAPIGLGPRSSDSAPDARGLEVLLFGDPQPKLMEDVGHYERGIVQRVIDSAAGSRIADLGLTMGDVSNDDPSLYPALNRATARMGVPWLHAPGNHDIDMAATSDDHSLASFQASYGPDSFAWEEDEAAFIVLDNVIWQPGTVPKYIGGFRDEQFSFLENYLRDAPRQRLLVLAMHIPLFEPAGRDTFRDADRARLFSLLAPFPHVLVISAHNHTQQHVFHGEATGWAGATPLHEYNIGATCGAFWSGVKDAAGVPVSTMSDGTPKGWARMTVQADGRYALSYHPARDPAQAMHLHAPKVLRRGAYPAWGVYANVYMGMDATRVEYRVDGGPWRPMQKVMQADPALLAENRRDDEAEALRGYDRSPEATPSPHLWRGALPTDLAAGEHVVEVRVMDRWQGEQRQALRYRLQDAMP